MNKSTSLDTQEAKSDALRKLFDEAAIKSMGEVDALDAEPEMASFLNFVREHAELRPFAIELFTDAFSERFYRKKTPTDFLMYCMHALRWPEIKSFIQSKKEAEIAVRGSAYNTFWDMLLEAFDDSWEAAKYYQGFKANRHPV